jgi:hypothetical protein
MFKNIGGKFLRRLKRKDVKGRKGVLGKKR